MHQVQTLKRRGIIALETQSQDLEDIFSELGPIKRCFVVKNTGNKEKATTVGFVTYALEEDAKNAIENLSNSHVGNHKLIVEYAKSQPKRKNGENLVPNLKGKGNSIKKKEKVKGNKKARIIIRNLSFKVDDADLKKHFEKFGTVTEVNILTKPDGKRVGCAFIQFTNIPSASKAIKECNAKEFFGRPVALDWAVAKNQYNEGKQEAKEISHKKEEEEKSDDSEMDSGEEIKVEPKTQKKTAMRINKKKDMQVGNDVESEYNEDTKDKKESSDDEESEKDEEGTEEEYEEGTEEESEEGDQSSGRKKEYEDDAKEKKTVFIRNLSFDTTREDLQQHMQQFGEVIYTAICMNPATEHSRGTAFVKFKSVDSASKCIAAITNEEKGGTLDGRKLYVHIAVTKDELTHWQKEKEEKKNLGKDKRNLFLAREGLIRPGTMAAADVSKSDLNKRMRLEKLKRQLLKNLTMFISSDRLCVHNLPPFYTDKHLQKLFLDHGGKGAKITEAKVIRDMKLTDNEGRGLSKEYGFVRFTRHENALEALRNINNNPEIFSKNRRPIVEFSVENTAALNAKKKRMEKSQEKNPFHKKKKIKCEKIDKVPSKAVQNVSDKVTDKHVSPNFMGTTANKKVKGLPTHTGPKVRHKSRGQVPGKTRKGKITRNMLRKQKKKPGKRKLESDVSGEKSVEQPSVKEPPKKKSRKHHKGMKMKDLQEEKRFSAMVENYKKKLLALPEVKKKKWFE